MLLIKIVQNRLFHLDLGTRCLGDKDFSECATTFAPHPYIYISISCCLPAAAFASNNISLCSRHSLIASLIQPALPQHQKPQVQSIHYCYLLRGTRTVFKRNSVGLGVGKESINPRNRIHQFNSQFSSVQFSSVQFNQGSIQSIRNQSYYYCNCEDFE